MKKTISDSVSLRFPSVLFQGIWRGVCVCVCVCVCMHILGFGCKQLLLCESISLYAMIFVYLAFFFHGGLIVGWDVAEAGSKEPSLR